MDDRVLSTGGGDSPAKHSSFIEALASVFAKNLSVKSQLLGPQNCCRMPQNHSQNLKKLLGGGGGGGGGGGYTPRPPPPPDNCSPRLQPPAHQHSHLLPQAKNPRMNLITPNCQRCGGGGAVSGLHS